MTENIDYTQLNTDNIFFTIFISIKKTIGITMIHSLMNFSGH